MKPSWNEAPDWATYLAMDADGQWHWYEVKPYWADGEWLIVEYTCALSAGASDTAEESLEPRP